MVRVAPIIIIIITIGISFVFPFTCAVFLLLGFYIVESSQLFLSHISVSWNCNIY
jgi:hypothetical protein